MQPRLYNGLYAWVDGSNGCELYPDIDSEAGLQAYNEQYGEGAAYESEEKTGFYARLSAPGYMDCTAYTPIDSESDVESFFEMWDLLPEED